MYQIVFRSAKEQTDALVEFVKGDLNKHPLESGETLNLVGYSGGGVAAFHASKFLKRAGIKVDNVVTLGTPLGLLEHGMSGARKLHAAYSYWDPLSAWDLKRLYHADVRHFNISTHIHGWAANEDGVLDWVGGIIQWHSPSDYAM